MSTPSKKRRKAREWMHKAKSRFTEEGHRAGFREGANRMRDDMMRLIPDDERVDRSDPHCVTVRHFIRRFPDPHEHGPYYRVAMPVPHSPLFNRTAAAIDGVKHIDFRPIHHAYRVDGLGGRAQLEWFTWEPTVGTAEVEARTSVLLKNYGMLCAAAARLRSFVVMNPISDLVQVGVMLDEGIADIGRVLGKFAPVEQLSPHEAFNRYIRFPMMNDRW